jgi:hypothetical protein
VRYELVQTADVVEVWSERRLPFEPDGDALRMRDELRAALRSLAPSVALTAEYTSDALGLCDVENVLHYNVGPAALGHLCSEYLGVERSFSMPALSPTTHQYRHHVRYRRGAHPCASWSNGALIAERRFSLPATESLQVGDVWFHARSAAVRSAVNRLPPERVSCVLDVSSPASRKVHAGAVLKVVVDGIVASLHRHDGTELNEVMPRLAVRLRAKPSEDELTSLLLEGGAEFGVRRLLFPRGDGVQWNPADDGIAALVGRVGVTTSENIEIVARVFEAVPRV